MNEKKEVLRTTMEIITADYVEHVLKHGVSRKRAQHGFRSDDFIAGAMAVFFLYEAANNLIPAQWVFGFMSGNDPIDVYEQQQKEENDAKPDSVA